MHKLKSAKFIISLTCALLTVSLIIGISIFFNRPEKAEEESGDSSEVIMISSEEHIAQIELPGYPTIDYTISEPIMEKSGGITQQVTFFRDGNPIYGQITHPKGTGPFKTIIISHGLYSLPGRYTSKAISYSEDGFAVIEFQYQNGNPPDDYSDPEYLGDYIFEEILDLYAVMDSAKYISYVDTSNMYLYGHSMGGLVASYVGTLRQNELKGLILVDPSFYATDLMEFEHEEKITTDIYPFVSKCQIHVLIVTGTTGSFGEDPHFFDDARAAFPNLEYYVIEGASHSMQGEAGEHLVDISVEAIESWG